MKKLIILVSLVLMATQLSAGVWSNVVQSVQTFFENNPTNAFEFSGYGVYLNTGADQPAEGVKPYGFGGGARLGYWVSPSVGAAIDIRHVESEWTFMSLGLTMRGTIKFSESVQMTPYVLAGAGWNLNGPGDTIVAAVGSGADFSIKPLKKLKPFVEYNYITSEKEQQELLFGIKYRF